MSTLDEVDGLLEPVLVDGLDDLRSGVVLESVALEGLLRSVFFLCRDEAFDQCRR